jgi:methionine biosynthesis protein MetW
MQSPAVGKTAEEKFQDTSEWEKVRKMNYANTTIARVIPGGSVLDLGCGDGMLLAEIAKKGATCTGIDLSEKTAALARERGVDCRVHDLTEKLPFPDNSFEHVILLDVLEHVYYPGDVLREAARVSSMYVYISTPNFVSLPARIQVLCGKVPENNKPRMGHVYWMTQAVVSGLARHSGLVLDESYNNTFWEDKPLIGSITRRLVRIWPSLFALSFVARFRKV